MAATVSSVAPDPPAPKDLQTAWTLAFGSFVAAFPVATVAVFGLGADRRTTADVISVVCSFGIFLGCGAALMPLPGLRGWSWWRRLRLVCLPFLILSYATHLSWELTWVLLHDAIGHSRDAAWAYPWWAYIDGGDLRYLDPRSDFVMIEILSVANGSIGAVGLYRLFRSGFRDRLGALMCMATAVVHLYSASWYFGSEILAGLPNVNTSSFIDTWIKFGLLNAPWLVFPWFVLYWTAGIAAVAARTR
jgi:hypothetical protein